MNMPVYIYECQTCGRELEIEQNITDNALLTKKHKKDKDDKPCNGSLKRLIAGKVSFNLKGTGWTAKTYQ